MSVGDVLGFVAFIFSVIYFLGLIGFFSHRLIARLRLRPVHRRTVRALISVIHSESSEQAKISQMRSRYRKYIEAFNIWHWRLSPPRLSVYLEEIAIDLDSMEPAEFKSVYNIEVPPSTREALHSFAEKVEALEMEQSRLTKNETKGSTTESQNSTTKPRRTQSSSPLKVDVQREVEAYKDEEARYRRQTLRATYISIVVGAVVGILGIISTLIS